MLILTRKVGESILLGDNVEIFLTEVNKNSARIGIEAPKSIPVYRKEIYEKIKKENQEASSHKINDEEFDKINKMLKKKLGG